MKLAAIAIFCLFLVFQLHVESKLPAKWLPLAACVFSLASAGLAAALAFCLHHFGQ